MVRFSGSTTPPSSQKGDSSGKIIPAKLSPDLIEKGKKIALDAGTGWDIYAIEQQFYEHVQRKGNPDNYAGAWIGFVKNKAKQYP